MAEVASTICGPCFLAAIAKAALTAEHGAPISPNTRRILRGAELAKIGRQALPDEGRGVYFELSEDRRLEVWIVNSAVIEWARVHAQSSNPSRHSHFERISRQQRGLKVSLDVHEVSMALTAAVTSVRGRRIRVPYRSDMLRSFCNTWNS